MDLFTGCSIEARKANFRKTPIALLLTVRDEITEIVQENTKRYFVATFDPDYYKKFNTIGIQILKAFNRNVDNIIRHDPVVVGIIVAFGEQIVADPLRYMPAFSVVDLNPDEEYVIVVTTDDAPGREQLVKKKGRRPVLMTIPIDLEKRFGEIASAMGMSIDSAKLHDYIWRYEQQM